MNIIPQAVALSGTLTMPASAGVIATCLICLLINGERMPIEFGIMIYSQC
jgi:hypothetical protein